jgi:ATP-dependent DNA ligase
MHGGVGGGGRKADPYPDLPTAASTGLLLAHGWIRLSPHPFYIPAMSSLSSRTPIAPAGFIEPCPPSPADKPPSGSNWIHEIKHDGYRLMARRDPRRDPAADTQRS